MQYNCISAFNNNSKQFPQSALDSYDYHITTYLIMHRLVLAAGSLGQ